MQRGAEELTGTPEDDSLGSHQIGEMCYQDAGKAQVSHETEMEEDVVMAMAQQSVISPEREESVKEAVKKEAEEEESGKRSEMHATAPVPAAYSGMRPEYREKMMKHDQERKALMDAFMARGPKMRTGRRSSQNPEGGGKQEDAKTIELGQSSQMMSIRHERRMLEAQIREALVDIQEKLANRKNVMKDKETLQLLQDMSDKLDVFEDQAGDDDKKGAEDQTCLDNNDNRGNSSSTTLAAKQTVAEEMADEAERFTAHRRLWEYKRSRRCGFFEKITVLSSMQFTAGHSLYTPGFDMVETLQIFSIKLTRMDCGLEFPLSVYGVIAVRDMVDRNRNLIFCCDISKPQELNQNDPCLHLIGPSRAIMCTYHVCIEIELRVKGSQDKALISCARRYTGGNCPVVSTICFKNVLCTLELSLQPVKRTVQATILSVQITKQDGSWPLKYGGLVACEPRAGKLVVTDNGITRNMDPPSSEILLIDSEDQGMSKDHSGHIHLWRQVVSVEFEGGLDVVIRAYSKSRATDAETRVHFTPKVSNISQKYCALGDAKVTITVAWSLVHSELC